MARARTGTLVWKSGSWQLKVTSKHPPEPGKQPKRDYIDLGTTDPGRAKQLKARAVRQYYADGIQQPKHSKAKTLDLPRITVSAFADEYYERRRAEGIKTWEDERRWFDYYVKPFIGEHFVENVTTSDLDDLLLADKKGGHLIKTKNEGLRPAKPLMQESIEKVKSEIFRVFRAAKKARIISENPADSDLLTVPKGCGKKRPYAQLTDAEFLQYVAHPDTTEWSEVENAKRVSLRMPPLVDREVKVLAIVARTIGGCRTSDLHALTWERIDTVHWKTIEIFRPKVSKVNERIDSYEIPMDVLPVIKTWWREHGSPKSGPVFPINGPCVKKERLGERKTKGSYARRFRRDLLIAGVDRAVLHRGDAKHSPTVFHALRGAFVSALKAIGVSPEVRMRLASHTSYDTHERYAEQDLPPQRIPSGAIPALRLIGSPDNSRIGSNSAESPSESSQGGYDSNRTPGIQKAETAEDSSGFSVGVVRFERTASGTQSRNDFELHILTEPVVESMLSPVYDGPGPVGTIDVGTDGVKEGLLAAIETAGKNGDVLTMLRLTKVLVDVLKGAT